MDENEYCKKDCEITQQCYKDKVKRDITLNMIMDILYSALTLDDDKLEISRYNLKEECLVYLLKEFDEERFKMIFEMKKALNDED